MDLRAVLAYLNSPFAAAVLLAAAGYWWANRRFGRAEKVIRSVIRTLAGQGDQTQLLLLLLNRQNIIQPEDWQRLAEAKDEVVNSLLEAKENPLTRAELEELRGLYARMRQGYALSLPEARRLNTLVDTLKRSRPDNEGTWVLAGLAGLALGFALGAVMASAGTGTATAT